MPGREVVLLVDDDPQVRELLGAVLAADGRTILAAATGAEGRAHFRREDLAVLLLDVGLPDGSGLDLLEEALAADRSRVVIMLTGQAEQETVSRAMSLGAMDYLTKPFAPAAIRVMVDKALALARRNRGSPPGAGDRGEPGAVERYLVGRSPAMLELYKLIGRLASSDLPVLIRGESGTGKELVARALHHHGRTPAGPFVAVDCGSLPAGLLESELFGHERGAFTGAEAARAGRFEMADGGTIFLDEIANLTPDLQAKLLRALQERTIQRLGAVRPVAWRARVVAATNAGIRERVAQGQFREDLLYRLAGVELRVPPLRERREDIPALVDHFLARWAAQKGPLAFSPAALAALSAWSWPGNVRELEHAVNRAGALARGPVIEAEEVVADLRPGPAGAPVAPLPGPEAVRPLDEVKQRYARQALAACHGNRAETARRLGIDRKTLLHLLGE